MTTGLLASADFTTPVWVWVAFTAFILAMLAVDLLLHREAHVISFREAAIWSVIWIGAGLAFGIVLLVWQGGEAAATYYSGFLIEKALSIDNVFVFALIFTAFAVPEELQHRVLFYGVLGALAFRLVLIFVGAELLERFSFMAYVFGAFLVYTGYKMAFRHEPGDPRRNVLVRGLQKAMPVVPEYRGQAFFVRENGVRAATLLFVVLVAVEGTDLVFAIDSVAAILAITTNTFIVWTANAFALLGLRALYFCLAGLLRRFVYLHYGLAFLLVVAGVKLVLSETPVGKVPIWISLPVILLTIVISIVASLRATAGGGRGPTPA
jgi:tellurite resistance protein TerC